jgi:hypothetical protein
MLRPIVSHDRGCGKVPYTFRTIVKVQSVLLLSALGRVAYLSGWVSESRRLLTTTVQGRLSRSIWNSGCRPIPAIYPSRNTVTGMTATPPIAEVRDSLAARLLKGAFDIDMQHCPNCGAGEQGHCRHPGAPGDREDPQALGLQAQPPPRTPAREPEPHLEG